MDFVVLVVKLIQCVLLIFNDNKFSPNQWSRVLKAIFNSLLNSVRLECYTKILVLSANNIGKPICSTLLGKLHHLILGGGSGNVFGPQGK